MIERIREVACNGLRGAAGLLPAQQLRSVQVARWMLRTLADAIEPIQVAPLPNPTPAAPKAASAPSCASPPPVQIMTKPTARFHKAAKVGEIAPGSGAVVAVGDKMLALFNVDGTFYALDNQCLHRGGPIGEGELAGNTVTCPWHGWRYDVATGTCETNPGAQLACYRVKIEGDEIHIAV